MRIVQFIDSLRSGGKERQLVELLKGLMKEPGVECELITMSKNIHYGYVEDLGIKIHYLVRSSQRDPMVFFWLYRLIKEIRPDILHSWSSMCSVYALPAVKLLNIKFINGFLRNASPHLSWRNREWRRARLTFPFSDAVVANSKAGLKAYNAPVKKSHYIYNGFDLSRVQDLRPVNEVRQQFGIPEGTIVGMVATFSDNKDYGCLIKVASIILKKMNNLSFVFVGDGPNLERDKKSVPESIRDKIIFLGRQKDVEHIINCFDIGVLSSSSHGEGISNSIMEYMALAKPVVATDCGGNRELIVEGETGYLVQNGDVNGLAERLLFLLEHPAIAREMGVAGSHRLIKIFSLHKMTDSYLRLYNQLLVDR